MEKNKILTLVVEDNPEDAKLLEKMLENSLVELYFADNLIKALQCLQAKKFDIILLDLFLPESRGIKTLHRVHEKHPDTPIIALTRFDDEETGLTSVKEGAQDYMVKGEINRNMLIRSILYSIERFKNREALKENEKRLSGLVEKLQSANVQLKEFSYSVSHDLSAPLRAITGFSEILERRYRSQLDEKGQHYLNNIVQAGKQMGMLIDDLLSYSRLGQGSLKSDNIDMEEFFSIITSNLASRIKEKNASIELPEEHPKIYSNNSLLKQIFANLFANAMTFHKPGVPPVIKVYYDDNDPLFLVIHIADNGVGISTEHFGKIFDVFQRLHTQDEFPGTGIGLSIVKKALGILKGKITLDSEDGKGSIFSIHLPRHKIPFD